MAKNTTREVCKQIGKALHDCNEDELKKLAEECDGEEQALAKKAYKFVKAYIA